MKGVNIGPFSAEIVEDDAHVDVDVQVDQIEIQSSPIAGCVAEVLSPPLKIKLQDFNGHPVENKKVRIDIFDENGLLSSKSYSGKKSGLSDHNGIVIFDDLTLHKTGNIQISILVDSLEARTENIDILPPGLNVDFWNEAIGSLQYEEKFDRALRMLSHN